MNKLPMSFDWKTAKENTHNIGFRNPLSHFTTPIQRTSDHYINHGNNGEFIQSLMMHIQNQVKVTHDINGWNASGRNAYAFVVNKFVIPMLMNYLATHKLDTDGIISICQQLKQDPDNAKFTNNNGLQEQAKEYPDHVEIAPNIIMKAIVDRCL